MRVLVLLLVTAFCFVILGCHTMKGAAQGAKQDWNDTCKSFKGADSFVKKNLW